MQVRLRLAGDDGGEQADEHQQRRRSVGERPHRFLAQAQRLQPRTEPDDAGARSQHADAIGGDIAGHARGLLVDGERLHAVGIDDDVLRRRGEGDDERAEADHPWGIDRVARAEKDDRRHQHELRGNQPRAAAAKTARQSWHLPSVDHRCPDELERVRQAGERQQADGAEVDAAVGHPHAQRLARQRQRQTGGKAEQHDDEHAGAQVDRQGGEI